MDYRLAIEDITNSQLIKDGNQMRVGWNGTVFNFYWYGPIGNPYEHFFNYIKKYIK